MGLGSAASMPAVSEPPLVPEMTDGSRPCRSSSCTWLGSGLGLGLGLRLELEELVHLVRVRVGIRLGVRVGIRLGVRVRVRAVRAPD